MLLLMLRLGQPSDVIMEAFPVLAGQCSVAESCRLCTGRQSVVADCVAENRRLTFVSSVDLQLRRSHHLVVTLH